MDQMPSFLSIETEAVNYPRFNVDRNNQVDRQLGHTLITTIRKRQIYLYNFEITTVFQVLVK